MFAAIIVLVAMAFATGSLVLAWRGTPLRVGFEQGAGLCCIAVLLVLIVARWKADRARLDGDKDEARFRAFMDPSPTVAYLKDREGRMLYVNDAYCNVFAVRTEQVVGKLQREAMLRITADQLHANDLKVIESRCAHQFEESIPAEGGAVRNWLSFKFPVIRRGHHCAMRCQREIDLYQCDG
jgi:PAS domain S-box-containing protein